jgi:release factor glutamine methyltransferase
MKTKILINKKGLCMHQIINTIIQSTNLSTQQAWWLLEFVTEKSRIQLQFAMEQITLDQQQKLDVCIKQIAIEHKPLAYILGWVPFLDLKILVTPPTLIPRPETESWVNELIQALNIHKADSLTILDIGTGSGCIALSLAQAFPHAQVYALDIAQSALTLAQQNAGLNNISNIAFLQSDIFSNLPAALKFDLIVSIPPYIDPAVQLDRSVATWEDHGALFASNQGMDIIEQIAQQAHNYLKKNNELDFQLVIEFDACQGMLVKKLLEKSKFAQVRINKDQFDRDRTAWAK